MKMDVISEELYDIGISLFDGPDQSVPGDHRSGLRPAHVAEVLRQRRRERGPAVFVEPLLGRVVLLVVDQLEEQPVVALGPRRALPPSRARPRDGSVERFVRQRRALFYRDMTSRTGQRVDPGEQLLPRGDGQIDQ